MVVTAPGCASIRDRASSIGVRECGHGERETRLGGGPSSVPRVARPVRADRLHFELEAVTDELQLDSGRRSPSRSCRRSIGRRTRGRGPPSPSAPTPAPGWPAAFSIIEGAAFFLYSRGALDVQAGPMLERPSRDRRSRPQRRAIVRAILVTPLCSAGVRLRDGLRAPSTSSRTRAAS